MRNKDHWKPSKYVYHQGRLRASRNISEVSLGSRLMADCIAAAYDQHLKKYVSGKLIDLGCGKVPLYEAYRQWVTDNICVDWHQSLHGTDYHDLQCDLTRTLPFPDNEFDTAILSDVLEHIPEPSALLREIYRILKAQGILILNFPFYYPLHEVPFDFYRYTEYGIRYLAFQNGFHVILLQPIGGIPEILTDILSKQLYQKKIIGKAITAALQNITWKLIQTRIGKKISDKTATTFPFGYFVVMQKP